MFSLCRLAHRSCSAQRFLPTTSRALATDADHLGDWLALNPTKLEAKGHDLETISFSHSRPHVLHIKLNRPKQLNAMNMQMWVDLGTAFERIEADRSIKAVIVSGEGRSFTSGMDLNVFTNLQSVVNAETCEGRKREHIMTVIKKFQHVVSAPERCRVPVIAAVHGACIGAGVDFISACDLRYCDTSAVFSVKEVDLAIVADVGTLQRLPYLVGEQQAKELSFTGRNFSGVEAEQLKLALKCFNDQEALMQHVDQVAGLIADKSPITIRGIKQTIHYQRDHTTDDALRQVQYHNAAFLHSEDLVTALGAIMNKSKPTFRND